MESHVARHPRYILFGEGVWLGNRQRNKAFTRFQPAFCIVTLHRRLITRAGAPSMHALLPTLALTLTDVQLHMPYCGFFLLSIVVISFELDYPLPHDLISFAVGPAPASSPIPSRLPVRVTPSIPSQPANDATGCSPTPSSRLSLTAGARAHAHTRPAGH